MEERPISLEPEIILRPESIDGVPAWWSDRRLVGYILYVGILTLACSVPLVELGRYALREELHSHILLIPLISIYLATLKWEVLPRERHGSVTGAVIFAVASAAVMFGPGLSGFPSLTHNDGMTQMAACYVLLLVSGGFSFLGASWMRLLAFPIGLLVFMVPLPDMVVVTLEDMLMRGSAWLSHMLFQWTGTPVFRAGQVMELPGMTLEVARNCSGIRSSLVLLITSLIASYLFLSSSWHRTLLVALVIPLGIFRNAIRVLVIGLLCVHQGPQMIDSWIHHHGGPVFFAVSLIPLFLTAAWFRQRERKAEMGKLKAEIHNAC